MNYIPIWALILSLILSGCHTEDQGRGTDDMDGLQQRLDSLLTSEQVAGRFGGTVALGNSESIYYEFAGGTANRSWDLPINTETRFDIASVNKSMTAALIMKAMEEGRLSTSSRLTDLLEGYDYSGPFDENITIHQLLTHTSGLADYGGVAADLRANDFRKFKRMHFTNGAYVDFISRLEPVGQPGEQFHYSNFGYHLLQIILEDIYEEEFNTILQEKIAQPLGMSRTLSATNNQMVIPELAEGYRFYDGEWISNSFIDLSIGRRVFSTAKDLYRWARAMNDATFLGRKTLHQIQTNHLRELDDGISYGYGWAVAEEGQQVNMGNLPTDKPYIIHGGSTEGYKSIVANINRGEHIIALLANTGNRTNELVLAQKITELILKK